MTPAGQLDIRLHWQTGSVQRVELKSSRPFQIQRLFVGKTPEQALAMMPLLFNVCGIAQGHAALSALSMALGLETDPTAAQARQMLVWLETAREHGWRILSDWPGFAGVGAEQAPWGRLSKLIDVFKAALFDEAHPFSLHATVKLDRGRLEQGIAELESLLDSHIFAGRLSEFLTLSDENDFVQWLPNTPGIAARLCERVLKEGLASAGACPPAWLPALDANELHSVLSAIDAETFIAAPTWHDKTFETGALSRQRRQALVNRLLHVYGNGLLSRLAAILAELAETPRYLKRLSSKLNGGEEPRRSALDGLGLAQIEAARGLLIHRVLLNAGHISEYQIVAPTEWNFHPEGLAASALSALTAANETELKRQAAMLISAIDPCVGYRLTIDRQ